LYCITDAETGCVLQLTSHNQRKLLSMLYWVPDVDVDLMRQLTSLCRCGQLEVSEVIYCIQVLQNR